MNKSIQSILFLAFIGLFSLGIYSCKSDKTDNMLRFSGFAGNALAYVPSNAFTIGRIDVEGLMNKADFESMKEMDFYQEIVRDAASEGEVVVQLLEDPRKTGIDLGEYAYFFAAVQNDKNRDGYSGSIFKLKDAEQFKTVVAAVDNVKIEQQDGFQFATNKKNMAVAWSNDIALLANGNERNIDAEVLALFTKEKTAFETANTGLKDALLQHHDITVWMESDALSQSFYQEMKRGFRMMGIREKDLKGNYFSTFVDFEKGFMVADSEYKLSKALDEEFGSIMGEQVRTDFTGYIPQDDLLTATSMSLNYEGIYKKIKESGMMGFANMGLMEFDLTVREILEIFGDDWAAVTFANEASKKSPSGLFITTIKDKATFEKVLDLGEKMGALNKIAANEYEVEGGESMMNDMMGDSYEQNDAASGIVKLFIDDETIFVTNRNDILSQVKRGKYARAARIKGEAAEVLTGNKMGLYINGERLSESMDGASNDKIENMIFTMKTETSKFLMNMADKNQNSLKTLTEMIEEQYEKENIRFNDES